MYILGFHQVFGFDGLGLRPIGFKGLGFRVYKAWGDSLLEFLKEV